MVVTELIAELVKIQHLFEWRLGSDPIRMPNRRTQERGRLRATCKAGPEGAVFDPIGAVCFTRTGQIYDTDSWIEAADAIGLSLIAAGDLTAAVNDRTWRESAKGGREPDPHLQSLRSRLISAVGLGSSADLSTARTLR